MAVRELSSQDLALEFFYLFDVAPKDENVSAAEFPLVTALGKARTESASYDDVVTALEASRLPEAPQAVGRAAARLASATSRLVEIDTSIARAGLESDAPLNYTAPGVAGLVGFGATGLYLTKYVGTITIGTSLLMIGVGLLLAGLVYLAQRLYRYWTDPRRTRVPALEVECAKAKEAVRAAWIELAQARRQAQAISQRLAPPRPSGVHLSRRLG